MPTVRPTGALRPATTNTTTTTTAAVPSRSASLRCPAPPRQPIYAVTNQPLPRSPSPPPAHCASIGTLFAASVSLLADAAHPDDVAAGSVARSWPMPREHLAAPDAATAPVDGMTPADITAINAAAAALFAAWEKIKTALAAGEAAVLGALPAERIATQMSSFVPRLNAPLHEFVADEWFGPCLRTPQVMDLLRPALIAWCEANLHGRPGDESNGDYRQAAEFLVTASFEDLLRHPRLAALLMALQAPPPGNSR